MVLDANEVIAHLMWFVSKRGGRGAAMRRRNMEGVTRAVDEAAESGDLAIPDTVANETVDNLENAFESAAQSAGAPPGAGAAAVPDALEEFKRLYAVFGIHDDDKYRKDIDLMFAETWRDPRMAGAVARWQRVKERHGKGGARPSLETHWADFVILSTAADRAARGEDVKLVTFDHDLVAFAGAIRGRFGVEVVDGAGLPR